jgi:Protein of unknown function (DUF669).
MSIPKSITFSKDVVESTQGDGSFDPLPAGNYDATIFSIKAGEFGAPKEGKGDNSGKPYWNVQYRIEDGQYANRRLFQMVGLFTHWAPKPGQTEAPVNFNLPQFLKAVGVDVEAGEVEIPDPEKLGGYPVTLKVAISKFNESQNEVKSVHPRGAIASTAKVTPVKPKAVGGKTVL